MSFLHFGTGHADQAWSGELVIHHAGIPLALFVLLQDYRFVLLDAFVRFLANALLAAVLTGLVIEAAFRLVLVERASREPLPEALLLISVCLFLVFFAWLRGRVQSWLTQAVFRQGGLANLVQRIRNAPEFSEEEPVPGMVGGHPGGRRRHQRLCRRQPYQRPPGCTLRWSPRRYGRRTWRRGVGRRRQFRSGWATARPA